MLNDRRVDLIQLWAVAVCKLQSKTKFAVIPSSIWPVFIEIIAQI